MTLKNLALNDATGTPKTVTIAAGSSSVFPINYFANPSFETDTTGVTTYADAAGTTPVDGTGGSPNITATRNTTTPLDGTGDLKISKDAANRQGNGVALALTVPRGLQSSRRGEFTFFLDTTSANYVAGDLRLYLYDVTNSMLITPNTVEVPANYRGLWTVAWSSITGGASVRALFHVASTSALAWDVYVDNVVIGPGDASYSPTVTGWIDGGALTFYAQTTNPTKGTTTYDKFWYQRVGSSLVGRVEYRQTSGSAGSGAYAIALPTGLTVDTSKLLATGDLGQSLGSALLNSGGADAGGNVYYIDLGSGKIGLTIRAIQEGGGSSDTWSSSFFGLGASLQMGMSFTIPIAEWAGSDQVATSDGEITYLSGAGSWNADDTTTKYGPDGASITGSISATRNKTLTLLRDFNNDTDVILVEVKHSGYWTVAGLHTLSGNQRGVMVLNRTSSGGTIVGITAKVTAARTVSLDVGTKYGAYLDGDTGSHDWNNGDYSHYRVIHASKKALVGFDLASGTQPGLVKLPTSQQTLRTTNGYGSTNTNVIRWTTQDVNVGANITYADSSTLGGSFTINRNGIYSISLSLKFNGVSGDMGITLNGTTFGTGSSVLAVARTQSNGMSCVTWTGRLVATDVIRAVADASALDSTFGRITVTEVVQL